jgi:hypothetical protein
MLCIFVDNKYQNDQYALDIKNWIKSLDHQKYYEDRGYHTYRFNILEFKINHLHVINNIRQQIV